MLLQVVTQSTISQGVADGIRYSLAAAGVVVGVPLAKALVTVARSWGAFGEKLDRTESSVAELVLGRAEETAHRTDIVVRLDRTERILVGDEGTNGVRGDVGRLLVKVEAIERREAPRRKHARRSTDA